MSTDAKARYAAAGFVVLLLLSVFWPSPVVSINRLSADHPIGVDEFSFLGREAPAWDVIFWCIAGLFALAIVQSAEAAPREMLPAAGDLRLRHGRRVWLALGAIAAVVVTVWLAADAWLVALAERVQSDTTENLVRILNRFGGGMNPPLIIVFFLFAGVAYRRSRWVQYAAAMAVAGLGAGAVAQALKFAIGRTRPELWLGPFHYARGSASSFPSGHTVGAFALAGVLIFLSPSRGVRLIAFALAAAVGVSRVLAFRHWPSDVVASALLGLLAAWIVTGRRVVSR